MHDTTDKMAWSDLVQDLHPNGERGGEEEKESKEEEKEKQKKPVPDNCMLKLRF